MNIKNYKIDRLNYCKYCDYNCEIVCPIYKLTKNKELNPKNKAIKALYSIKSWDFSDNIDFYACINCNNCTNYCPHKAPISEVLNYAKEKTITSNNANNKILKFEEDFYINLEKIVFLNTDNHIIIKNIPDFLSFYNIGFRDETITELKTLLRNIDSEKVFIEDISFIYLVNQLKNYLNKIKIPDFLFYSHKKEDYIKIVLSSLEITNQELYNLFIKEFNNY